MKKSDWSIDNIIPVSEYPFSGNQEEKAVKNGCTYAFRWNYIAGNVNTLPRYILDDLRGKFTPVYLGGTTYKYSVIGLKPVEKN